MSLGKENFYLYAQKFGFGQPTGIELPAEARGLFRSPATWNGDSLASMSIGYEIGVTALQMASAYGAIANNGVRVKPRIIKEIRHSGGKPAFVPELVKTPIVSPDAARGLRKMLRQVVVKGTARRAQLNGYTSSGKTGTAWKYNAKLKRVDAGKYMSSFIGMAPAENPSVVIAVVMDEPQGGARDGGQVSAPVFREIAEAILPEMNVVPDANIVQEDLTAQKIPSEIEKVELPGTYDESADEQSDEATKKESKKTDEKSDIKENVKKSKPVEKQVKPEAKKESKPENKSPNEDKKAVKQKPAIVDTEKKNKSSTEGIKKKT
jgi:cell division protein FtsI (penicillin-binding protein 3)